MNSFPQSHLSHLHSLHCHSSLAAPVLTSIIFLLFITLLWEASAMSHSFLSMWSFFLLHSASRCHSPLSPPQSPCFSMILCLFACFLWHNVSQFPIFLCTDPHSFSSPGSFFIPPSSSGQWLAAALLNLVGWEDPYSSSKLCLRSRLQCSVPLPSLAPRQPAAKHWWTDLQGKKKMLERSLADVTCHFRRESGPRDALS